MKRSIFRMIVWLAPLGFSAFSATVANADVTFTVNTTDDRLDDDTSDGVCHTSVNTCGLRAAIMQANHLSAPGVTTISVPPGTYTLTRPLAGANGEDNGDLNLTAPLSAGQTISIVGAGTSSTIIDANRIDGVLRIASGRIVILSEVTIRNGLRQSGIGGGVLNQGNLTVSNCVIEANQSLASGGGIASDARLNVIRSAVRANLGYRGGGMFLYGITTIRDSAIYQNGADSGGGIEVGGAGVAGQLFLTNSTISSNYANGDGGGIDNEGFTALYNTTIVNNDADHDRDQLGGVGGGVFNNTGADFVVVNSLIAGNTLLDAPIYNDCSGVLEAYGRNYFYDLTFCNIPNPGARLVSLNSIGPLQDNGGATWTHALLPGSEAINTELFACIDEYGVPLTTDQRGAARTAGGVCDAGAFEYGASAPPQILFKSSFE